MIQHLQILIDYLFCHFKELLEKIIQEKIIDSFSHYYVPNARIKDFNVLLDRKSFFDLPVKIEEAYEKIIDMRNNNDCTTGNLLDFAYFKKNYRLIAIDLSKQTKLKDPQQISFIGRLLNTHTQQCSLSKKNQKKSFNFLQNSVTIM